VVSATSSPDDIFLNFGAAHPGGGPGDDLAVQLLRRIALRPLTASHLQQMLQKLIAEVEAATRNPQ
jgi:hypothetical protein